jgi:hypothetical protein
MISRGMDGEKMVNQAHRRLRWRWRKKMFDSCYCPFEDADWYIHWTKIKTARKEYVCVECGEGIFPGQKYEWAKGLDNSARNPKEKFPIIRTCSPCMAIRKDYCPSGYLIGTLRENIWEGEGFDYVTGEEAGWRLSQG